jgi:hypothetical protein
MLGDIPTAVQTLLALADRIRTKGDPAAELILLPEGGELKEEHVTPVLKAFARMKRRRCLIDNAKAKLETPRLGVKAKAQLESQIERTRKRLPRTLPRSLSGHPSSTTSSPSCVMWTTSSGASSSCRARRG